MAEERTYSLSDFYYADTLQMYDKNGNTQTSIIDNGRYISGDIPGQERGQYFVDMTKFIMDFSATETPNRYELFEFANGVKIVAECINGGGNVHYENIHGAKITAIPELALAPLVVPGQTQLDAIEMWFNPFMVQYATQTNNNMPHPDAITRYALYQELPQPDFPHMDGFMEYEDLERFFYPPTGSTGPLIDSDEKLMEYINALKNGGDGSPIIPEDPEDDISGPGGGDGDYNPHSNPVDFPDLPITGDSISTGFIRVYNPSGSQLQALANKLWSDDFYNTIKKIHNDPMEAVISLHSIPIVVPSVSAVCKVGNYDSQVAMPAVTRQFHTIDLGSIHIPEHWGSALDYSPYVKIQMFLPFVGVIDVQVDDIIGKTISVSYNIDILSGACVASVKCAGSVLYTYNTNVIFRHPITQSSYGPLYQALLGMGGAVASGGAQGGSGGALGGAVGGALNVALSKWSSVTRGSSLGGATGVLGHFVPYIIIHRPIQSLASGFKHFKGYPSNITGSIGSVTGYTEVESVHLTGIPCTDAERDEIQALLYNGVIV